MGTYEVEVRSPAGELVGVRRVRCGPAADPALVAEGAGLPRPDRGCRYVYRVRRGGRGRVLASVDFLGEGRGGGTAGVREPRRPLPGPGSLTAEAGLPPA